MLNDRVLAAKTQLAAELVCRCGNWIQLRKLTQRSYDWMEMDGLMTEWMKTGHEKDFYWRNGIIWNESGVEWNEVEWNENEKERLFIYFYFLFLENIGRQKFLIFALYFMYKTANQWLVFRLIHYYYYYYLDDDEKNKDYASGEEWF